MDRKKIASGFLLALILVPMGVGAVAPLIVGGAVVTAGLLGVGGGLALSDYLDSDETIDEDQTSAQEVEIDGYAHADTLRSGWSTYSELSTKLAEGQEGVMWTHAKVVAVRELNNGSTKSQAKIQAKKEIDQTAARMELTLLEQVNKTNQKIAYLAGVYKSNDNIPNSTIRVYDGGVVDYPTGNLGEVDYTLHNGTTVQYLGLNVSGLDATSGGSPVNVFTSGDHDPVEHLAPTTDYDKMVIYTHTQETDSDPLGWNDLASNIDSRATRVHNNIDTLVNNLYANYTAGELNTTDVLSGYELARMYSSDWRTTGHNAYAAGTLAAMGLNGTLTNAFKIQTESGAEFEGQLFVGDGANLSSVSEETKYYATGKLADPANFTDPKWNSTAGHIWMTADGDMREITGNFTVLTITDTKTGEALTNTTFTSREYDGVDVDTLGQLLDQLAQDREDVDEQAGDPVGAPPLGGNLPLYIGGGVGVLSLAGAAWYASRN